MPTIIRRNGAILLRDGAIAASYRCCCPGEPPLPQTCCQDVYPAHDDWPAPLYGQMSGFGCPGLNRPFYMGLEPIGTTVTPTYRSNYLGGVTATAGCIPPRHSSSWRIDLQCLGNTWGLRLSDSVPWSNGDFTKLYPVLLLSCDPLVLRITNLPDAMFGLNTSGTNGAIVLTSVAP
jgi:hypothetical protein